MLNGMVTLRAGWAVWGKEPGTRQDYSVLACSAGPFSRAEFEAIITRFAVGSPDVTATGPAALPWVTVSWVGVDDDPHLGISITGHTGQVDGVGRPITKTAYFCLPYAQLTETPVSYCDLYDAVLSQAESLRPVDGPMLQFPVPAAAADRMADTVRRVGEQTATAAAALLLSGAVTVAEADGTTLRDRLEFIDAVASLLPYGYRVRFSGATWSDTGTKHRVRLAFAARPREDAAVVHWRRTAAPAGDRVVSAYSDRLRRLCAEPGRGRDAVGLAAVIAHLAVDTVPRTFDKPQAAIDCLNQLDQPFLLLRAARERTALDVAELRQFLRSARSRELGGPESVVLLTALADNADAQDWPLLRAEISAQRSAEDRVGVLMAFGRGMLWAAVPPDSGCALDCVRLAADVGFDDAVLAELIRPPDDAAASPAGAAASPAGVAASPAGVAASPAGVRAGAELLANTVLAAFAQDRPYPRTAEFLDANPAVAAEYVTALSVSGRASALLRWLDPSGTAPFTRCFRIALGIDHAEVSDEDLALLGAAGPGVVGALLSVSSGAQRLDGLLPAFTRWLARRDDLRTADQHYWAGRLSGLRSPGPVGQAWLDTALLMAGGSPAGLPPAEESDALAYADALAGIWLGLSSGYPGFSAEHCAHELAAYLTKDLNTERRWTATSRQALAVTEVAKRLVHSFDPQGVLAMAVATALAATPSARRWDFAQDWLAWAADNEPGAVRDRVLDSLATAQTGADPDYLAGLCVQAHGEGIDIDTALRQLARSGALSSAAHAYDVLSGLHHGFIGAGTDEVTAAAWEFRLSELLASGECGVELAHELRALVSDRTRRDIWLELRLLGIFAEEHGERQYEWTEAEHKDLAAIAAEIESMLKRSRRFQFGKRRRGNGGNEDTVVVPQRSQ
jgi:hypothetical protein